MAKSQKMRRSPTRNVPASEEAVKGYKIPSNNELDTTKFQ